MARTDGTKWNVYEQNLLSEYYLRYGGYGGIGYYHVSGTYIALFSHFIPCGVYEAVYILDGLVKTNRTFNPIRCTAIPRRKAPLCLVCHICWGSS